MRMSNVAVIYHVSFHIFLQRLITEMIPIPKSRKFGPYNIWM